MLFISKASWFFRVAISSSKLHDFYADSLSNSMQLCKLSSELHGKMPKKYVLISTRKIRCFLKIVDFDAFFISQCKAPQKSTSIFKKILCFIAFSLFKQKLHENSPLLKIAPTVCYNKCPKWSQANYRSFRFKDTCSKNFEPEAPQL